MADDLHLAQISQYALITTEWVADELHDTCSRCDTNFNFFFVQSFSFFSPIASLFKLREDTIGTQKFLFVDILGKKTSIFLEKVILQHHLNHGEKCKGC